ncbi:hypothetical protein BD779DRAFT_545503 [Infundibulicybe gibba]|nr:hypothetical protein BD779DRAFT_545503 [Infundibulicybe gibba]
MSNPEILSITWGSVPICALVSMVLDGCLTMQTYTYFRRFFHRDHPALKYTVAIIWFFSISHVVCGVWVMHNICVAGYYLPANDIIIPLGFAMEFLAQSFVNFGVQAIYVSRLFRFSHNVRLLICLCVPLAVQIGIGFFAALRVAHTVPAWQVDVWNEEWGWMVTTPFAICASMDVAITVSVCHQLWRTRMAGLKRTQNMVDKLIRWTIRKLLHIVLLSTLI